MVEQVVTSPRHLTITIDTAPRAALRNAARDAFGAQQYRGETLSFDSPAAFFVHLTPRRWTLIQRLQSHGGHSATELARALGGDRAGIDRDLAALAALGLVEPVPDQDRYVCPFGDIHVDLHLREAV